MIRRHLHLSGRVQGVFYRDSCRQEAQRLGVGGWVRNLPDGRVEVVAEGDPELVLALVEWCRQGPPQAHVADLRVSDEEPEGLSGFDVCQPPRA